MADTNNLTNFLGDVADAIRAKTGGSEPISAADFDTEIANIPTGGGALQEKSVTITENGTTEITPDSGYDGLSNVNITTNIASVEISNLAGFFSDGNRFGQINDLKPMFKNITSLNSTFRAALKVDGSGDTITRIDFKNIDATQLTDLYYMFGNSTYVNYIDISNWELPETYTSNTAIRMQGMFSNCSNLLEITGINQHFAPSDLSSAFGSTIITELNLSNFDTQFCKTLYSMCSSCSRLKTVNVSNWNTSNCTSFSSMFNNDQELENIDISSFDFSKANSNLSDMFKYCGKLTDASLESIVHALLTYIRSSGKTLKTLGLTSTQATTCTRFTEWETLSANGWTTGYES